MCALKHSIANQKGQSKQENKGWTKEKRETAKQRLFPGINDGCWVEYFWKR